LNCSRFKEQLQIQSFGLSNYGSILLVFKGVMTWTKVASLVCRFWSLPWTNGSNTQFKWKLRYSPIQCACLEPSTMYFSNRRRTRIGLELLDLHWFLGVPPPPASTQTQPISAPLRFYHGDMQRWTTHCESESEGLCGRKRRARQSETKVG